MDAGGDARRAPLFEFGNQCDVLRDGKMRKEAGFLDNVSNPAP